MLSHAGRSSEWLSRTADRALGGVSQTIASTSTKAAVVLANKVSAGHGGTKNAGSGGCLPDEVPTIRIASPAGISQCGRPPGPREFPYDYDYEVAKGTLLGARLACFCAPTRVSTLWSMSRGCDASAPPLCSATCGLYY